MHCFIWSLETCWSSVGTLVGLCCTCSSTSCCLVFVSVAMLAHLDQCSAQLKTLKRASRSLAKTGLFLCLNGGLKMRSKIVLKKWFQRVPKWTPKVHQNRQKGCSGGVSKRDLKKGPSPGSGKVRFCYYLLHFSKVGGLKKDTFLGTILGAFGRQNR